MYQKVILVGNLGGDPELKTTPNGNNVCKFSLATSKKFNDKETTQWHRVVTWNKTADNCNTYLKKGSKVMIEGEIEYRSWDDENGNKKYMTEIVANVVKFLDSKTSSEDIPF